MNFLAEAYVTMVFAYLLAIQLKMYQTDGDKRSDNSAFSYVCIAFLCVNLVVSLIIAVVSFIKCLYLRFWK